VAGPQADPRPPAVAGANKAMANHPRSQRPPRSPRPRSYLEAALPRRHGLLNHPAAGDQEQGRTPTSRRRHAGAQMPGGGRGFVDEPTIPPQKGATKA